MHQNFPRTFLLDLVLKCAYWAIIPKTPGVSWGCPGVVLVKPGGIGEVVHRTLLGSPGSPRALVAQGSARVIRGPLCGIRRRGGGGRC